MRRSFSGSRLSSTWAPSGSLRTMSCSMCAGTVTAPGLDTSAGASSDTSRSRSVALNCSVRSDALSMTLDRMGIVVRRSTTLVTWPRARRSSPRSITSCIRSSPVAPFSGRRCPLGAAVPKPLQNRESLGDAEGIRKSQEGGPRRLALQGSPAPFPGIAPPHNDAGAALARRSSPPHPPPTNPLADGLDTFGCQPASGSAGASTRRSRP